MSSFDTHGGYFAPKDYMKVEAGGTHEENPNGGVQIGVDQEGTPNLLEEGEPVYKDYVYSDNIKASERFLKDNNIPEKYAGELYSKIADSFFSEAENRPYDPISRNGLEAMLGRLADAQEGQKAYNEQRQLERELKNLSPDELAALEEMLAAQEQPGLEGASADVPPMPAQPEMVPQEQMAPEQMPMMRNGGRLFAGGGDKVLSAQSVITEPAVVTADDPKRIAMEDAVRGGINRFAEDYVLPAAGYLVDPGFGAAMAAYDSAKSMLGSESNSAKDLAALTAVVTDANGDILLAKNAAGKYTDKAGKLMKQSDAAEILAHAEALKEKTFNTAVETAAKNGPLKKVWNAARKVDPLHYYHPVTRFGKIMKGAGEMLEAGLVMRGIDKAVDTVGDFRDSREGTIATERPQFAYGGPVNRFDWKSKLNRPLAGLMNSLNYRRDTQISPTNIGYVFYPPVSDGTKQIHPGPLANAWNSGYMWNGYTAPEAQSGEVVTEPAAEPVAPTIKRAGATKTQYRIPTPQDILDQTNARILAETEMPRREPLLDMLPTINGPLAYSTKYSDGLIYPGDEQIAETPETIEKVDEKTVNPYLSTLPRYAGAIGAGLLGLYNAFQRPDRYTATRYKPFTPTGRISLQDQVYNPVDQNMLMNQVLAQGNSTQRALRNSGLGPSTAAAMIAQDNNITGNLGNTFLQAWDANNQRRNQVIAANNQNEAQRAQFDYAVDAARQRALAEAQMRNVYTDLQLQQLNYGAEGDKYAAISNQISNALQALSGIGQENFAMNQVNSNPTNEGYGAFNNGVIMYDPYRYARTMNAIKNPTRFKCGGKKK